MRCYNCKATLSENDFCTKCGGDVALYKKVVRSSEAYYNKGLEKARARDLSGAVDSLRRSVKLYKNNTKARNLLGLVYFEMGEPVAALSEWVISKNLDSEKNLADYYLDEVQRNATRLDTINQTIKKYNQALLYAKQNSNDLAIIQLKKVLQMYPNLVKGYQLLALLYIKEDEYEKAYKTLKIALKTDINNVVSLKYMKEVQTVLKSRDIRPEKIKTRESLGSNDVIISPNSYKESNAGGITVLNVIIGIILGATLVWFLILPAKEKGLAEDYRQKIIELGEQMENKGSIATSLEKDLEELQKEKDIIEESLKSYEGNDGIISAYENMIIAVEGYLSNDYVGSAESLKLVEKEIVDTETFNNVYSYISSIVNEQAAANLYKEGYNGHYLNNRFEQAAQVLQSAYDLNPNDVYTLYYLARSYDRIGDTTTANQYYAKFIEEYPGTTLAGYAKGYLDN